MNFGEPYSNKNWICVICYKMRYHKENIGFCGRFHFKSDSLVQPNIAKLSWHFYHKRVV